MDDAEGKNAYLYRPVENKVFGIRIEEPEVDFATTARSFGIWSTGPVTARLSG